jgi:hypothetical protein
MKQQTLKSLTTKIGSGATPRGGGSSYKSAGTSLIRSLNVYDLFFSVEDLAHIDDSQAKQLVITRVRSLQTRPAQAARRIKANRNAPVSIHYRVPAYLSRPYGNPGASRPAALIRQPKNPS